MARFDTHGRVAAMALSTPLPAPQPFHSTAGYQSIMRRSTVLLTVSVFLFAFLLGMPSQARTAATPEPMYLLADASPKPKKQKTAASLIHKQAPPKVAPRILENATPDNVSVYVSLEKQRVFVYVDTQIAIDAPISSGKRAGMTPTGRFNILEKDLDHRSSVYGDFVNHSGRIVRAGVSTKIDSAPSGTYFRGAPMRYFMRLTSIGVGMHAGYLPGYPASHGCIRLPNDIAALIYQHARVGTPVTVGN